MPKMVEAFQDKLFDTNVKALELGKPSTLLSDQLRPASQQVVQLPSSSFAPAQSVCPAAVRRCLVDPSAQESAGDGKRHKTGRCREEQTEGEEIEQG